jgi:hypothetical protein
MDTPQKESLMDQLRALLRDLFDYINKTLELQQARFTSFALSGVLFVLQIIVAFFLAAAAFILFNVAIGLGLAQLLGSATWAVVILGLFYMLLAGLLSFKALRWLKKLQS